MVPLPNEVFLSHSSLDRHFATEIAGVLRQHGIPIWFSEINIIGAQQWHDEIGAALKRCDWLVVLLSPNSVESIWVKREVLFALNDRRYAERIVPVLYQPCDYDQLSWTLSLLQIIDFAQGFENGCRRLLQVWGVGYRPPQ
ncbi:MAG: toll/interleukin-1 receptor domain-containing protein [Pyrinomonadaceae bacterium]